MIEVIIKKYFDGHLNVPSFFEHQESISKLESFVMIERTGGRSNNQLKSAVIAIQSYASTMYKAAELNEEVKKVVAEMIELDSIARVQLNSDYNFTDTETKRYRYQAVFDINYY
ncbi:hypothetical protein [Streptococcus anginosus]|uniref:hypothetical protein n=1 Tax=Streptococcus anginosus TaxID=1328 RepID=UPI001C8C09F6|nr:hypothetical protein [Streptococcus anginosus]MBX9101905.1 hypothetical protein [Streptococcus anginosus]MBX9181978.1 hypothetical protein [Paeniclostridium sordellii]